MATMKKDFMNENWWTAPTASGGTISGSENFWWGDKDRHRSGKIEHDSTEYGEMDMYTHSTNMTTSSGWPNHPTDVYLGRKDGHTGRELDRNKADWD